MRRVPLLFLCLFIAGASPCGGDDPPPPRVVMDYAGTGFWDVPYPDEARRGPTGTVSFAAFDRQGGVFAERLLAVAEETPAFGTTSPIFFRADTALDPATIDRDYTGSVADDAPVSVVRLDGADVGTRHPVDVRYASDGGPWGAPNMIEILPLQGLPLAPDALYAAVVTNAVLTATGAPLARAPALDALLQGAKPAGMSDAAFAVWMEAVAALSAARVVADEVVALAVFRTADPTAELRRARDIALASPLPVVEGLALTETHDEFCVYEGTTHVPDYQRGTIPYDEGGAWDLDTPPIQALARVVVTIPRAPSAEPVPTVVLSRTGAGGDRPLVDRGVRDAEGVPVEPGSGPAREFALAGWAGVSIDGPHGGPRNPGMADEQFLIFNVNNPVAMRDNIRQSALELVIAAHVVDALAVDAADCVDVARTVRFDARALMGHSMGATIAPLAFAIEDRYEALLLSGAGGSWIMNVVYKESPLPVRPLAEALIGVSGRYMLHEHDPLLGVLQWAGESADPPVYAVRTDRGDVLMMQGIVDTYILPPMANATSLSYRLDLGGPELDATEPRLDRFLALRDLMPFAGTSALPLPVRANRGDATRVVVQHAEDGIEDGHEVVFQTDAPKSQYRCFLETLLAGTPTVPAVGGACE